MGGSGLFDSNIILNLSTNLWGHCSVENKCCWCVLVLVVAFIANIRRGDIPGQQRTGKNGSDSQWTRFRRKSQCIHRLWDKKAS